MEINNNYGKMINLDADFKHKNKEQFVLHCLESEIGEWISGGDLAERANVSRNTIWRVIKKLQEAGYVIESVTGRGYRLIHAQDLLSESGIRINLNNPDSYKIEVFDTVDSTNNLLKEKARQGAVSGTLLVANAQEAGRGRRGRSFFSPPGTGIYFSLLIRPEQSFDPGQKSPALAAVALANAIDKVFGKNVAIKWVNDIYLENRKIAGILSEAELDFETRTIAYLVIGIGVNVYQPQNDFPEDIQDIAAALTSKNEQQSGLRNKLIAEFVNQWEIYSKPEMTEQALAIFRNKSYLTGKIVDIWHNQKMLQAEVVDIDSEFELLVKLEDGSIKMINHGEATLHQENK